MVEQDIWVRINAKSTELLNQLKEIISSTEGFRIHGRKEVNKPELLIFELSEDFEEEFKVIESLSAANGLAEIFVTSRKEDSNLLLRALRLGIKEFLPQPLNIEEVKRALDGVKTRKQRQVIPSQAPIQGQIIYVMGSKGGVGTTTVAVNLAMNLVEENCRGSIALMDMNTVFGEVPLFLSMKPAYDWGEIAKNVKRLDTTFLMNVMARHPSGIHILPSPNLNGHPSATPETMGRLLGLMRSMFEYVVIDGGQSLDGTCLKAIEMSDMVLFIILLNLPCLANTNNVLKSLSRVGIDPKGRFKIIVNRLLKKTDISLKEAEKSVQSEIFWTIPNDYRKTMSAINQGKALREIAPRAPIAKNMAALVDFLRTGGEPRPEKKGWTLFRR
ncbi:MAG: cobyrinic acid a,c-diamide synthase [Desulfobacteraceae bacterium]|nr:MAG: cobyrinic acid a,c-diamide synthase [Desulfobacteraceae bacterium]